ncbi:MAG: BsuBI/PstI family type II restriction endonuclease, partial [Methanoregula sp.]|nr:BsuBI/PstI family type II restriction endonuclease [Methanoregula sp.]
MSKIDDALKILTLMGIPKAQQNDRSALTLLAVLDVKKKTPWKSAKERPIIIHDIMGFIKENYAITYAENSRETIRRQTLHQFEQAGIVIRNRDDPKLSTNSPKNNYTITPEALLVIQAFKTPGFDAELDHFTASHGKLIEKYAGRKHEHDLTIKLNEEILTLTAGAHNELQIAILRNLYPRFFPTAELLYLGDAANKMLKVNEKLVAELHFPITQHDKLSDIVFYDRTKHVLFLIEAVTSHGPMSPKRLHELTELLSKSGIKQIFISAFPSKKEFKKYFDETAWETEVWLA